MIVTCDGLGQIGGAVLTVPYWNYQDRNISSDTAKRVTLDLYGDESGLPAGGSIKLSEHKW